MAEVWEGRERGPRDLLPAVHRGDLPGTVCVYERREEMSGVHDYEGRRHLTKVNVHTFALLYMRGTSL